jgi:hypothetical protein
MLGLVEKMYGCESEDTIGDSRKLHKKIIVCALVNNYGGKTRRPKCATLVIPIYIGVEGPLEGLARRPEWGRSRETFCGCRK